jgi:hypothetical protein
MTGQHGLAGEQTLWPSRRIELSEKLESYAGERYTPHRLVV